MIGDEADVVRSSQYCLHKSFSMEAWGPVQWNKYGGQGRQPMAEAKSRVRPQKSSSTRKLVENAGHDVYSRDSMKSYGRPRTTPDLHFLRDPSKLSFLTKVQTFSTCNPPFPCDPSSLSPMQRFALALGIEPSDDFRAHECGKRDGDIL